ncbi:hypothetical protein LCGC14_1451170 [marine sediment metagenome]|uniref:Uncharacterized protein n=1 Tax=marine sediment metagenome TaxID=412755 RepID=A0A0F9JHR6_9ZZZZ
MKYRIRKKDKGAQLIIYDNNFVVTFTGKNELKELLKYVKVAIGMEDDPKKPRADLRIVK